MIRLSLMFSLFFAMTGCVSLDINKINDAYEKDPDITEADMAVILDDWFNCDECVNGQLRRVQELGNSAVADLAAAYSGGGAPDRTDFFETRCERINIAIIARGFPGQECAVYKTRFQSNLERRYQRRAFRALVAIRTGASCDVIGGVDRCGSFPSFNPHEVEISTDRSVRLRVID